MKKILFPIFVLVFSATLLAQGVQPDAEYLLIQRTYTTYDDGSMDVRFRKEIKLNRNRAITAYALNGESFIEYNPHFELLTINECYTQLPQGGRVEPRESAYVEQLPSSCTDCSRLNDLREMVVVHTGLEAGCTIVLDYTLHRQSNLLYDHFDMMQRYPVHRYEVVVNGQTIRSEHGIPQDEWSEVPYAVKPARYEVEILLGTLPRWETERTLPEASWVDTMTQRPALERAQAICNWVRENVVCRHGLDLSHLDYKLASASDVYRDNCGTPAECVGLTVALLNRAGLDATLASDSTVLNIAESFRIDLTIDNMKYRIDPLSTQSWKPLAAAIDEANPVTVDSALAYEPTELSDGYFRLTLPQNPESIDPALLTPSRNVPVAIQPCDEQYHYTISLPKKVNLVGKGIQIKRSVEGVGNIEISVKQKGRRLDITRKKVITCSEIDTAHYADFRLMMLDWQRGRELFVK